MGTVPEEVTLPTDVVPSPADLDAKQVAEREAAA